MADRIVVLKAGRVEQIGTPLELYNTPCNKFVAGFIGSPRMNFLSVRITDASQDGVRVATDANAQRAVATIPVRGERDLVGQAVSLGIRPEHIHLRRSEPDELALSATIELLEQLGSTSFLYCVLPSGEKLTVQLAGQIQKRAGEQVEVCFPANDAHLFANTEGEPALERLKSPEVHLSA
jgi:ABC-type sugar transport system ATPase subunit